MMDGFKTKAEFFNAMSEPWNPSKEMYQVWWKRNNIRFFEDELAKHRKRGHKFASNRHRFKMEWKRLNSIQVEV